MAPLGLPPRLNLYLTVRTRLGGGDPRRESRTRPSALRAARGPATGTDAATRTSRRGVAHVRAFREDGVLCVHPGARSAQAGELDLRRWAGRHPVEVFGLSRFPPIGELSYLLTLAPRGFFWFTLEEPVEDEDGDG